MAANRGEIVTMSYRGDHQFIDQLYGSKQGIRDLASIERWLIQFKEET